LSISIGDSEEVDIFLSPALINNFIINTKTRNIINQNIHIPRPMPVISIIASPYNSYHIFTFLKRKEFAITDTELKLMATAAIIGDNSRPKNGYSTPAATGTPREL
jgi:hypothetical protein